MKKLLLPVTVLLLTLFTLNAYADSPSLLTDGADLLTYTEEESLLEKLKLLTDKYGFDVAVMTSETLQGYDSAESAATELYEASGYSYDGIMLFICMETREWYVLTSGECIGSISYNEIGYIEEQFINDLSNGYYYDAFNTFAVSATELSVQDDSYNYDYDYDSDYDYDYGSDYDSEGFSVGQSIAVSLVIGLVVALIVTGIMRGQLKSVKSQPRATSYIVSGSMNVTEANELYLYRTVTKHRKADNNSSGRSRSSGGSHRSSSGRSYGGRGGRF